MLGMETITNKEVNVRLDNEKGILCLTGLLAGTMVFLYDSQGELRGKHKFAANKEAGIKILIPNGEFYASKVCDTFEEAIDLDVEALEKQLVKYKEKQRSK